MIYLIFLKTSLFFLLTFVYLLTFSIKVSFLILSFLMLKDFVQISYALITTQGFYTPSFPGCHDNLFWKLFLFAILGLFIIYFVLLVPQGLLSFHNSFVSHLYKCTESIPYVYLIFCMFSRLNFTWRSALYFLYLANIFYINNFLSHNLHLHLTALKTATFLFSISCYVADSMSFKTGLGI